MKRNLRVLIPLGLCALSCVAGIALFANGSAKGSTSDNTSATQANDYLTKIHSNYRLVEGEEGFLTATYEQGEHDDSNALCKQEFTTDASGNKVTITYNRIDGEWVEVTRHTDGDGPFLTESIQ